MDGRGVRRVGQVIRIRPERIEEYERLHAQPWPGVLATLRRANVRNYSIFRHGELLFAYFEYLGDDYAADMAGIAADPVTQEWWKLTAAMQEPLPGRAPGEWWLTIPEVFHTD
jgi:L-rhamnose mutarotase